MIDQALFSEKIRRKSVLLDTGIIIRAAEHGSAFKEFVRFLKEAECSLVSFSFIEFEFLRGAFDPENRKEREEFLEGLSWGGILPFRENDLVEDAIKIANAYATRKLHSPSIIDCSIAVLLKKHADSLFLVTLNHKDFPTFLFDRVFVYPIDTDKDIFPLAFYQYNPDKAKKIGIV